jgi:deoxyadenosine/deoxycytidine kinase
MLYRDLYDALVTYDTELPHAVIYLEVSDDTLAQRREWRGSVGESVPRDYANALRRAYEEELRDYESRGGLVYRLDWNDDLRDSAPMYAAVTERVLPIYQEVAQLLSTYEINEN